MAALSDNNNLFKPVGGDDCHIIFLSILMSEPLNIPVCRLCLLGIYHMYIMIIQHLCLMALQAVSIKHGNQITLLHCLVITQNIQKLSSCSVQINLCKLFQFLPGKDNVIAVYQ